MVDRSGVIPELRQFLEEADAAGFGGWASMTVAEARESLDDALLDVWGEREPVETVSEGTIPTSQGEVPFKLYRSTTDSSPCIVFFHGGGWVLGSVDGYDGFCRRISRLTGSSVVSVEYRLAPESPYPAAIHDAWEATKWVVDNAEAVGAVAGEPIALLGDSAGANLAAVVAVRARDNGLAVASQVLIYPVTDLAMSTESYESFADGYGLTRDDMSWYADQYVSDPSARADPDVSPLQTSSLAGLAPTYLATAEFDPLRDEGEEYARQLNESGVDVQHERWDGTIHGFLVMDRLTDTALRLHERIAEFVTDNW